MNNLLDPSAKRPGAAEALAAAAGMAVLCCALLMVCEAGVRALGEETGFLVRHAVGLSLAIATAAAIEIGILSRICPIKVADVPSPDLQLTTLWWFLIVLSFTAAFFRLTLWATGWEQLAAGPYGWFIVVVSPFRTVHCWHRYRLSRINKRP